MNVENQMCSSSNDTYYRNSAEQFNKFVYNYLEENLPFKHGYSLSTQSVSMQQQSSYQQGLISVNRTESQEKSTPISLLHSLLVHGKEAVKQEYGTHSGANLRNLIKIKFLRTIRVAVYYKNRFFFFCKIFFN